MNKFAMVLGTAAVVTLAGCKDPNYKYNNTTRPSQDEVKNAAPIEVVPLPEPAPACKCLPGTRHTKPCACGAADCACIVEPQPVIVVQEKPQPVVAPVEETTTYIVQRGDYLAKISKKFNVTINSIRRLNPSIKKDIVRVGMKLRIPGKHDYVAPKPAPKKNVVPVRAAKKAVEQKDFSGATKTYVVKNGDTLGAIAYSNGITIRQLKKLNGLTNNALKIGQKLKVPAEKVVAAPVQGGNAAEKAKAKATDRDFTKDVPVAADAEKKDAPIVDAPKPEVAPAPATNVERTPAVENVPVTSEKPAAATETTNAAVSEPSATPPATMTYVVQPGEDLALISINWGITIAEIRELNNLGSDDQVVAGQILKLPAAQ